jgi:hypothetical protein
MGPDLAEHLYVHLPFCAHRCGYCDFVTAVGRIDQHPAYVEALLAELELERHRLAARLLTVFVGGGTPTFTEPDALARLLAALPPAGELTVEANPETVTPLTAALLRAAGVNRVSLGAQSFRPHLLAVLERRATPDDVRRAVHHLRDASFDNISLDLLYGIPGQSTADLEADLTEAIRLGPEHLSCYELEAKPGTRFTHRHGDELERQSAALEGYFERVVDRLTAAGYRWYETANFCRHSAADATSVLDTIWPTGRGLTTSASVSAQSRPSPASAGGMPLRSPATWRASVEGSCPPVSSRSSIVPHDSESGSCSACGSTSRCSSVATVLSSTKTASDDWRLRASSRWTSHRVRSEA